ncbi:kinase-like protein [Rhizoclosmatium globosum]|uniref:Kinase-like protein n=1 Tax=Rhizoclosmatium globosum TaxID=329046 RepID=A0A1Y2C005_9FUNG|nr:kinase-like protein [Rhizoclosmatium globosum]|eukprot:ORY39645.1 kinase-like protein [Rhizoclosmatium globosum]
MPPLPIKNWTLGKMIGQGSFGRVYMALNLDNGEFMAVKQVLLPVSASSTPPSRPNPHQSKQTEALQHELEMLRELSHVNIVRYLGFEIQQNSSLNVFLQYVSGGSIASLLRKTGKLDLIVVRYFTFQILCGLAYLHSKLIIHRDIKSGNVLVDADGICKITDFGTSKKNYFNVKLLAYKMAYQRMTRMSMQGSIPWMAPEVVVKGKGYSAKVDVWSCGCLVLEMLTGVPPWHNATGSVVYLLGNGNAPPIPSDLPEIAQAFLKLCFIVDPEQRPTAAALIEHEFCRLTEAETDAFDFQRWVLEAEERHAAEVGVDEDEEDSSETDSDDSEESDESEEDDEGGAETEASSVPAVSDVE